MYRVFEIFPLVFILFLYVRVDFNILSALVLNILVQVIIDSALQLVIIIDVLDHCVYRILHAIDNSIVSMYCVSCSFDMLLKGFLSGSQVINHKPDTFFLAQRDIFNVPFSPANKPKYTFGGSFITA